MSDNTEHAHVDYWKIYKWLLLLFVISVLGPALFPGIKFIVLLTAFGIAIVKALLVANNFMHLNVERIYIWHLFLACLVFLFVLFAGVAGDVLNKKGNNWVRAEFAGLTADVSHGHDETTDPKTTDPKTTDPKTTDPAGEKPDPKTTDPKTTDPKTTDPKTTDPKTTDPKTTDPKTTDPAGEKPDPKLVAQGKTLFQTKICFTCHQTDTAVPAPAGLALKATKFTGDFWGKEREVHDGGPTGPIIKVKLDEAYFLESVEKPMAKILKGAIPGMAPLPTTEEERKALAAYVKSLSK